MQCCKKTVYSFEKYEPTTEQMRGGKHLEMDEILCCLFRCCTFLLCLWTAKQFVKSIYKCKTFYMRVALSQGLCWRVGSDRQLLLLASSWSQQCGIESVVASLGVCFWTMFIPSLGQVWGMRLTVVEKMQLLKMSLCPRCRRLKRKGQ